jgi:ParB family chromosome partitioning protein
VTLPAILAKSPFFSQRDLELPPVDAGEIAIPDGQFWIRVDQCEPDPDQPRKWFDPTEMAIFAAGLKEFGQQNPAWAKRVQTRAGKIRYQIIDGERRWRACVMNGTAHLLAVFKRPKTAHEQLELQAIANFGRAPHPALEIAHMIERLRQVPGIQELSHGAQMQKLTGVFCQSVGWVTYHHSLLNLHPELQARLDPALPKKRQMRTMMAVYLSSIPDRSVQLRIWKEAEARGMSVKQATDFARKLAAKEGVAIGGRKRQPHDDFRSFKVLLRRVSEMLGIYLDMPDQNFRAMFLSRNADELEEIFRSLEVAEVEFGKLVKRTHKATQEPK